MDENIKVINLENSDKKTSLHFKKILAQRNHKTFQYGSSKNNIRLNDDNYKKPEKTITDLIQTREAIDEKLMNYEEIEPNDLNILPKNVHISYITYDQDNNMELYRLGGYLRKVADKYIVLAGKGNKTFSVQREIYDKYNKNKLLYITRFFAKKRENNKNSLNISNQNQNSASIREELRKNYEETIVKSSSFIKKQNDILEAKQREIALLKAQLDELQNKKIKNDNMAPIKSIIQREQREKSSLFFDDNSSVKSTLSNKSNSSVKSSKSNVSNKSANSIKSANSNKK